MREQHAPRWVLVDFDTAAISSGPSLGSHVLTVTGTSHKQGELSLGARLVADKKYQVQPDYAEVRVEYDMADALFPTETPYTATLSLAGVTGRKGVTVVGRNKTADVDLDVTPAI